MADPADTAPKRPRPRGRPALRTKDETRALLIDAARTVFLAQGYSGTGIEAVAHRAGVSTRTIYETVSNKADLFRMVVEDAIKTSIAHLDVPIGAPGSEAALGALVQAYADIVLSAEAVLTARVILAEQAQFPELGKSYLSSIQQVSAAFDERFAALCLEIPKLDHAAIKEAAELLRSMVNGAQRAAILDPDHDLKAAQIADWANRCTQLVLRALRKTSG